MNIVNSGLQKFVEIIFLDFFCNEIFKWIIEPLAVVFALFLWDNFQIFIEYLTVFRSSFFN